MASGNVKDNLMGAKATAEQYEWLFDSGIKKKAATEISVVQSIRDALNEEIPTDIVQRTKSVGRKKRSRPN